jgi:gliding motility-associated-like protein
VFSKNLILTVLIFFVHLALAQDCDNIKATLIGSPLCQSTSLSYTQSISLKFGNINGRLSINDSLMTINSLDQSIIWKGKHLGGKDTIILFFENDKLCRDTIIISSPTNCCPFELGIDTQYIGCNGSPFTLTAYQGLKSYKWQDSLGNVLSNSDTLSISKVGQYMITASNAEGCIFSRVFNVLFRIQPNISIPVSMDICEFSNQEIPITTDANTFAWKLNDSIIANSNSKRIRPMNSGKYTLIASFFGSCLREVSLFVNIKPAIKPKLGPDRLGCDKENINLTVFQPGSIRWFRNNSQISGTPSITINQSGDYIARLVSPNNCQNEDTIKVSYLPRPSISLGKDTFFCKGANSEITALSSVPNIVWIRAGLVIDSSLSIKIFETGTYVALAKEPLLPSCINTDTIKVFVSDLTIQKLKDTVVCDSNKLLYTPVASGGNYAWIFGNSISGTTKTLLTTNPGKYVLEVSDIVCKLKDSFQLTFQKTPSILLANNPSLCTGAIVLLSPQTDGNVFSWERQGTIFSDKKEITLSQAGLYLFRASNDGYCANSKQITVTEISKPNFKLDTKTAYCNEALLSINPSINGKYEWYKNNQTVDTNKTFIVKSTGIYKLKITNKDGCSEADSALINVIPDFSLKLNTPAFYCYNDVKLITISGSPTTLTWSNVDKDVRIISDSSIQVLLNKNYKIISTSNSVCGIKTLQIDIVPITILDPRITQDTCIFEGKSADLILKNGYTYNWTPHSSYKGPRDQNKIKVSPDSSTLYFVKVTNKEGCSRVDSIDVCVVPLQINKFVPINVITPNNDGANDVLKFELLDLIQPNRLVIYNRWGNIVFEKNNYQSDQDLFDGTSNGRELPTDVYFYTLTFQGITYKESLTIIRSL